MKSTQRFLLARITLITIQLECNAEVLRLDQQSELAREILRSRYGNSPLSSIENGGVDSPRIQMNWQRRCVPSGEVEKWGEVHFTGLVEVFIDLQLWAL